MAVLQYSSCTVASMLGKIGQGVSMLNLSSKDWHIRCNKRQSPPLHGMIQDLIIIVTPLGVVKYMNRES